MLSNKMSNGESIVFNYLVLSGFKFKYGESPSFLKGLHADFSGLIYSRENEHVQFPTIIEYDGPQHFYGWGGNFHTLYKYSLNDVRKNLLCVQHHIHLIRLEDMKGLSSTHYGKAIIKVWHILNEELSHLNPGISTRFVSINLRDWRNNSFAYIKNKHIPIKMLYYIANHEFISISGLQNKFSIGFNRAQLIISHLTKHNFVSRKHGSLPRKVFRKHFRKAFGKAFFEYHHHVDNKHVNNERNEANDPVVKDFIRKLGNYSTISVSQLQRIYSIGYNRAYKVMAYLTKKHLVTKKNGAHARRVLKN